MDDRMKVQKVVCVAQAYGVPLGYKYGWHVRGPYSPMLAEDYYTLATTSNKPAESAAARLTSKASSGLQDAKSILQRPQSSSLSELDWLELAASVAYLAKSENLDDATVTARIKASKPWLSHETSNALRAVRNRGKNDRTAA
jgi:uncharacterized protein YwgA